MESMNKFKVLTAIVLCLFVFAIAAIYTNTKEASLKNEKRQAEKQTIETTVKEVEYADDDFAQVVNNIKKLDKKIDELTTRINNAEAGENVVNCKILGTLSDSSVEEMPPNEAVNDAKNNNIPLVITCRL